MTFGSANALTNCVLGHRVGMIANQKPVINADEARKGATFIKLCNQQYVALHHRSKEATLTDTALQTHANCLPPECHRLHGRIESRARLHHQVRCSDGFRCQHINRSPYLHNHGRIVWCRKLRHVRS